MTNDKIKDYHMSKVNSFELPLWMRDICCPFCENRLTSNAFRQISVCLNTRNFGDLCVQFACDDCARMDTLYFNMDIENVNGLHEALSNDELSEEKVPLTEDNMYKAQYNNIVHKMCSEGE